MPEDRFARLAGLAAGASVMARALADRLPSYLWTNVVPGLKHYKASGPLGAVAGQGVNLLSSTSFHEFVKDVRRFGDGPEGPSHAPISFFLAHIPCILIQDDADMRSVFKPDILTQATQPGSRMGPLAPFQELFGRETNPVLLDPIKEDGTKDQRYFDLRRMLTKYTMSISQLDTFTGSGMLEVIDQHLSAAAAKAEPVALTTLFTALAMDVGASLISGFREVPPSSFYLRSPQNRDLLENVLAKLADPSLFVLPRRRRELVEASKRDLVAYSLEMIRGNYDALRDEGSPNFVRDMWTRNMPAQPFPENFETLIELRSSGTRAEREGVENLLLGAGFLQLASTETSAQTMNFAVRELLNRPQSVQRIREELSAVGFEPTMFTLDAMARCPYLSAFVLETLRLYPPVAVTPWMATKTFAAILDGHPVEIPKGTWLMMDIERANQTGSWKQGASFDPERWLDESGALDPKKRLLSLSSSQEDFHTFSGGISTQPHPSGHSRTCPGRLLASSEVALTLARLVSNYDFSAVEHPVSLEHTATSTLRPTQEVHLKLVPRDAASA